MAVDIAILLRKVSDFPKSIQEDVYSLVLPVIVGRVGGIWSVARTFPLPTEVGWDH